MAATQQKQSSNQGLWKFLNGGLAGMAATCVVQPIDLIKNRMQLAGEGKGAKLYANSFDAAVSIFKAEGVSGMYAGLSAGLMRQATYTTTRLGVFQWLEDTYKAKQKPGEQSSFFAKLAMGMTAGGIGAMVGTPAEVALIRMTSDGRLPVAERRGYKNVFDAMIRIIREEGLLTLWRGWQPTVARAMILNAAQLGVYSQAKQVFVSKAGLKDGILVHSLASLVSGFVSTAVSMPVDITKTRLQTMKNNEYKGTIDCLVKTVKNEGFFSLWKGFTPYFLRLGPHTIITFIVLEQLNKATAKL
eukprot:TRINITY_DN11488_c0_g1_i1.p1 TRINITY_DN11488_c0_g1~~TRINITY_DN11488_c0_g1_i1.p1  ORF type:complete len:313 (-),score=87.17 TRINITY_DN11488_c0_g1_i1:73-975(-)